MKIDVLRNGRMQQTGSSLFRAIQNNKLPTLDLLTREVVQNSLDASDLSKKYVDFGVLAGDFNSKEFLIHLDELNNSFSLKYPLDRYRFLAFSDKNTVGLTGPLSDDEVTESNKAGNLLKLIYHIMKPQEQEGAGGSWGLGKTVYFRVGIGMVLYYSRVKLSNGQYQQRLAVTLVENEKEDTFIPKDKYKNYAGITWWGKRYKDTGETCPITDDEEINEILHCFNITPYFGEETGTIILIPYVNDEDLLNNAHQIYSDNDTRYPWTNSLGAYFRVAIQRWYGPRVNNINYQYGPFLRVSINRNVLSENDILPLFKIIKELYNENEGYFLSFHNPMIIKDVILTNEFASSSNRLAGKIMFIKVNKYELKMTPPHNYFSPYSYCSLDIPTEGNLPIITFTRKPCLIINYEFESDWTRGIPKTEEDEYLIGIFKLNSENKLLQMDGRENYDNLEQYIRSIELGDHSRWDDKPEYKIIRKIKSHVSKFVVNEYKEDTASNTIEIDEAIGRQVAAILLPSTGFGRSSTLIKSSNGASSESFSATGKNANCKVTSSKLTNRGLKNDVEIFTGKNNNQIDITISVERETGSFTFRNWMEEFNEEFPFFIYSFNVDSIMGKKIEGKCIGLYIDDKNPYAQYEGITCKLLRGRNLDNLPTKNYLCIRLSGNALKNRKIRAELCIGSISRDFKGLIKVIGKEVIDE
ncbi:hypothetical protein EDD63_1067 [Breznakia blatticola]|uniref:Uncharacterized protein n=1 Tax=Breznakia blatticola TaxID=1754012 RepID=A0A4R8A437_9FIRM|nr:hypothetical protein [Breznakia blatticola]TDW25066.1 hypothetical protein EDD63_1067 [Breznakia blatticola]